MDPNQIFNDVISFVENSQLNFCINRRTPFSANISIKSSLIKRFNNDVIQKLTKTEVPESMESLRNENLGLKKKLKTAEDTLEEVEALQNNIKQLITANISLENMHVKDKEETKNLLSQVSDFRAELLEVKSDKNKIRQKSKEQEREVSKVKEELGQLDKINKSLSEELKETFRVIESKKRENEEIDEEKRDLTVKLEKAIDEVSASKLSCRVCEKIFTYETEMSDHVREHHHKAKDSQTIKPDLKERCTQTESSSNCESKVTEPPETVIKTKAKTNEFEKHECFYCQTEIKNKLFLDYHRTNCHVKFDNIMYSFGKLDLESRSCKVCGIIFKSKEGLEQHDADAFSHNPLTAVGFSNWGSWGST